MSAEQDVLAEVAFARRRPDFMALTETELLHVNLEVQVAVATLFGVVPRVTAARGRLLDHCPKLNFPLIDALEDYGLSLYHAHGAYLIVTQPVFLSPEIIREGRSLRGVLLSGLEALARRGRVAAERWRARLERGRGHLQLANALHVLAQVSIHYATHGSDCDGTPIEGGLASSDEVRRAIEISTLILTAHGREGQKPEIEAAELMRRRTFTMASRSYGEARRGMAFLHWYDEDDSQRLPSLWARARHPQGRRMQVQATPGSDHAVARDGEGAASTTRLAGIPARYRSECESDVGAEKGPFVSN